MKILNKFKTSFFVFALIAVLISQDSVVKAMAQEVVEETPTIEVVEETPVVEEAMVEEPVVVEEPVITEEEPTPEVAQQFVEEGEALVCDESNNPIVTVLNNYYEYEYGAHFFEISGDLNINVSIVDPNGDPYVLNSAFLNSWAGGLIPHVGVYIFRYTVTDINGCEGFADVTIVINPASDLVCDVTNTPSIIIPESIYKYPNGASLAEITADFDTFFSLTDPNSPISFLKTDGSAWINELVGGWSAINFGDYVYRVSVMDEEGCTDQKEFTVRIGPDPVTPIDNGGDNDSEPTSFGSIGGGGNGNSGEGRVLGATTCAPYITKYMKYRGNNDSKEVAKLQIFLNEKFGMKLSIDGVFGENTLAGVKKFQLANASSVLKPWGIEEPTNYVYLTTAHAINMAMCPELNTPAPTNLIPFSQYLKQI